MAMSPEELEVMKAAKARLRRSEKWAGQEIDHPIFGKLIWEDDWVGAVVVPLFAQTCRLLVELNETPQFHTDEPPPSPEDWASKVWDEFCEAWPHTRQEESIKVLHAYVVKLAEEWLGRKVPVHPPELTPEIKMYRDSIDHFKESLTLTDAWVCKGRQRPYVLLGFETGFDEEHGLNLFFVKGHKKPKATFGDQLGPD